MPQFHKKRVQITTRTSFTPANPYLIGFAIIGFAIAFLFLGNELYQTLVSSPLDRTALFSQVVELAVLIFFASWSFTVIRRYQKSERDEQ